MIEYQNSRAGWEERINTWLHQAALPPAILAMGLLARLRAASGTYLNADETQHFLVANRPSLALAYKSSLTLAHPPLLIVVLYLWRALGNSEFALRMLSVVFGILFCWIFYKWVARVLDEDTAIVSLILVSLLPPLVSLSAQVRQYSLLLFFATLALYLFEKSLAETSPSLMLLSALSLCLAILSHYSAAFLVAAFGVYAILRIRKFRSTVFFTWAIGQAAALALFLFLYRTHISKLKDSSMAGVAAEGWLRRSYFHPGQDHWLLFVIGRTFGVFQFIAGHLAIGDVMGLCFIGAIVVFLRQRDSESQPAKLQLTCWQLAVLFTLPFFLNCAAALRQTYPFGGTRHSAFLMIFAIPAVSFILIKLCRRSPLRYLLIALLTVSTSALFGKPHEPNMPRADQKHVHMDRALQFIQEKIPPSEPLFVDFQTRLLLNYYICRNQQTLADSPEKDFDVQECGGRKLITANIWLFNPETFQATTHQMFKKYEFKTGDPVWVVQAGWSIGAGEKLKIIAPQYKDLQIQSFGHNIQIFQMNVDTH